MTNKEFFKTLSKADQKDIVSTLTVYDTVIVEYYNGEYHVTPHWCLLEKRPEDYKILNEFKKGEFDFQKRNYDLEWFKFWSAKEHKGEKNINGAWQAEFELIWDPIIENAIKKYIEG